MARIVKEDEYALRRSEILDATQRLVFTIGYAQMTIQDILDALEISKGAFYHYFGSKSDLLEGLISRMIDQALELLQPIVHDENLPAIEKLNQYLAAASNWKASQKAFFVALLPVWYADDNTLVRYKVTTTGLARISQALSDIIDQGINEGVFCIPFPERAGEVVMSVMYGLGDKIAGILLQNPLDSTAAQQIEDTVTAYTSAVERVLGARAGSIVLVESDVIQEWVDALNESHTQEQKMFSGGN